MDETLISEFIEQQFPQIYREEGPFFIEFLKQYYAWLETDSLSPVYQARRHLTNHDIDTTVDDFIIYFKEKYLKNIQLNTATNTTRLIKNALDLYRSKGSENSIKLFFDLIFSSEAEVYYPGTDIFRASSAEWTIPYYLEVTSKVSNRLLVGRAIEGVNSGATAFVERLVRREVNNYFVEVLYISAVTGTFETGEIVKISGDTATPLSTYPTIVGSLTTVDIQDGGTGFAKGDIVTLESRTGAGGRGLVTELESITGVVKFNLVDGGWGYTVNSNIEISDKVLLLSNVHVVSTTNTTLTDAIVHVYQPTANVQWFNNTANFSVGDTVYNYYANGTLIGSNKIIAAEYGTNTTTNFFLLNLLTGNNYMDANAAFYRTAGNTASFQVQNGGWSDQSASGDVVARSANVVVYCSGNVQSFVIGDVAYQISTNNVFYANASVLEVSPLTPNTFSLKVRFDDDQLYLTNQKLFSSSTGKNVSITSVAYDLGVYNISGVFKTINGNIIYSTANNSAWDASVVGVSFGAGANTDFDRSGMLFSETVNINTDFIAPYANTNINATSYGVALHNANLTNLAIDNALNYSSMTLGTIAKLQNQNPGQGYSYPPFVKPIDPYVAPMNKLDFVIRYTPATGVYSVGEQITQAATGAIGIVKFANTTEVHIKRLTYEDKWVVGTTNSYLMVGVSSGNQELPTEVTFDTDGIAGDNAIITTNVASSNSAVLALKVTDSGFAFRDGDSVTFTSLDEEKSGAAVASVVTMGHGSGFYKTTSGFLSTNKYLQDGEYYQDFSYEIRSPITVGSYSDMLKSVLHVAGTKVFASILKKEVIDSSSSVVSSSIIQTTGQTYTADTDQLTADSTLALLDVPGGVREQFISINQRIAQARADRGI
jgi:hypothetical protein